MCRLFGLFVLTPGLTTLDACISEIPDRDLRASENTDITVMAPGIGSDFVALIEQNRRHSSATSRILRLRHGEIWPEDGMLEWDIGIFRGSY